MDEETRTILALLVVRLEGQKYGLLDDSLILLAQQNERATEILEWLRTQKES